MEGSFGFRYCLLLLTVSEVFAGNSDCLSFGYWYSSDYRYDPYLYLKYEEALIKNHSQLEELRATFISGPPRTVDLTVHISAVNLTNTSCDDSFLYDPTFCSTSQHTWSSRDECPLYVTLKYTPKCGIKIEQLPYFPILYVSLMHGSFTGFHFPLYLKFYMAEHNYEYLKYFFFCYRNFYKIQIELNLEYLRCNPSCDSTQRVLSDMLSWVSSFDRMAISSFIVMA